MNATVSTQTWPKALPRFVESFRVIIDDDPARGNLATRILTSEWYDAGSWLRVEADFLPLLSRAGVPRIIARTSPSDVARDGAARYYGDADYPIVYWHPGQDGSLHCISPEEIVVDWCRRRSVPLERFQRLTLAMGGSTIQKAVNE